MGKMDTSEDKSNIIVTVDKYRTIIGTASSVVHSKDDFKNDRKDMDDRRIILVVDVMRIIHNTFKHHADRKRLENFLEYNLYPDKSKTFRSSLTEYYQHKLDADIRSFNRNMRKGGYYIGGR